MQIEPNRRASRLRPAAFLVRRARDGQQLGIGEGLVSAIGNREPCEQAELPRCVRRIGAASVAHARSRTGFHDIVRVPIEPLGKIGELQRCAHRTVALRQHRQTGPRRQILRHRIEQQPFGQAGTAQRFHALIAFDHDPALRSGAQDGLLHPHHSGGGIGPLQRDAAAQIGIDQTGGRQQTRVAILLDHAIGQAGNDRAFRIHALRHALEADLGLALRHVDRAGFGDQRVTAWIAAVDRLPAGPVRRAIDGNRRRVRALG